MAAHKDCQEKDYDKLFDDILDDIVERNMSASKALIGRMSFNKFYQMISEDENREKKYTRACILRAERVNDEIIDIADDDSSDTIITTNLAGDLIEKENKEYISRSRVRIDARKWWLSKTNPKKYGDKVDITSGDKPIQSAAVSVIFDGAALQASNIEVKEPE